jgi:hypothetical protein
MATRSSVASRSTSSAKPTPTLAATARNTIPPSTTATANNRRNLNTRITDSKDDSDSDDPRDALWPTRQADYQSPSDDDDEPNWLPTDTELAFELDWDFASSSPPSSSSSRTATSTTSPGTSRQTAIASSPVSSSKIESSLRSALETKIRASSNSNTHVDRRSNNNNQNMASSLSSNTGNVIGQSNVGVLASRSAGSNMYIHDSGVLDENDNKRGVAITIRHQPSNTSPHKAPLAARSSGNLVYSTFTLIILTLIMHDHLCITVRYTINTKEE